MIPILSIADLVLIVTKHTDLQSIITFMLQKISTHIVHITNGMASNVVYYKRECRPWQVSFLRCHQMGKTRRIAVAPIRTFASPTPWPPTPPPPHISHEAAAAVVVVRSFFSWTSVVTELTFLLHLRRGRRTPFFEF